MTKSNTIEKMKLKFIELMNTSISDHSMMLELYRIVKHDLSFELGMIDLIEFEKNSKENK